MKRPLESELHMLVDGGLNPRRVEEIETWLEENPSEKENVFAWRAQKEALRGAFDDIVDAPVPDRLRLAAATFSAYRRSRLWAVAASITCLMLGGFGGFFARDLVPVSPEAIAMVELPRDAAIAHAIYVPEVRHPVEVAAEQEAHLVQWLSKRVGHPLVVPNLRPRGYELVGGRLLPSATGAVAQFMYQDPAGARLTLYIRHSPSGGDTGFRFAREGKVSVFYWLDDSLGCALSGEMPREHLLAIAENVYAQIAAN